MGWFELDDQGTPTGKLTTGINLVPVYPEQTAPNNKNVSDIRDPTDSTALDQLWQEFEEDHSGKKVKYIKLSMVPDWHFRNLNYAFNRFIGGDVDQTLFVYCDVIGSSVVGNQETDLLREVI